MSGERKRIAVLAPAPLAGSGGHRTVYRNLNALAGAGYRVTVFVEGRRFRPGWLARKRTRDLFGVPEQIELISGWPNRIDGVDLAIATTWQSALHLGTISTSGRKAHFVQDYECLFYHEDDVRHALARGVHDFGFPSITIGYWLVEVLYREHGISARATPFSADLELYGGGDVRPAVSRRRMVVANYQPEKPRRRPELMEGALQLVLDRDPSVEVVSFGSRRSPSLSGNHRHLGVVEPKALASLYREAGVGLSMSATNPSRLPFEMMAAGLPVVELEGENMIFDLPEEGCLLSAHNAEALVEALLRVLDEDEVRENLRSGGSSFMEGRPVVVEVGAFVELVTSLLYGGFGGQEPPPAVYSPKFFGSREG